MVSRDQMASMGKEEHQMMKRGHQVETTIKTRHGRRQMKLLIHDRV